VIGLVAGGLTLLLVCVAAAAVVANRFRARTASPLAGVVDYSNDPFVKDVNHRDGDIAYPVTPPVGGPHRQQWQNCSGDVYTVPIDDGRAVHSLEHGAVWITYRPDLAADEVATLRQRVEGGDYIMMSPYPGQPTAVSLQAWGYQLRLDSADERAVDAFIATYRRIVAPEPTGSCSGGWTGPAD
jgi:hypothetical protein